MVASLPMARLKRMGSAELLRTTPKGLKYFYKPS